ncbi:hypothetical protein ESCO_005346 [Escovopsis weberi]|uniref:Heterokaryon incompatibility domain-containing protein n=1 Tax=Escovopsis weberi TaxID=150374 RepID=A0A0M9VV14_ESCWE|nr:hypothetical protein ESCO_005346 [Escovopsis weberi]
MTDYSDLGAVATADRSPLRRRRSKNPLRSMMQHLTVECAASPDGSPTSRRQSIMRRLSGRASRSPSAHSDHAGPGSRSGSALGGGSGSGSGGANANANANADPALCETCAGLAAEIDEALDDVDGTFLRAANPGTADDFEKREYVLARLRDLEDNRWAATCPLCRLFWAVRVPGYVPGEYALLGMSSRDTSYLVDAHKMYELEHPARARARGVSPGFLAVVSKPRGPGARNPDVNPDWFRQTAMLFRTRPEGRTPDVNVRRGRLRGLSHSDPNGMLAAPGMGSPLSSPSRRGTGGGGASPGGGGGRAGGGYEDGSWTRKGIWGREIGRAADLTIAHEWLRFCEARHKGRCGRRPVTEELEGFRLLDCAQSPPQVVERSITEDYLALSYVRGKAGADANNWPRVVRDAVAVTKDLGFRYLWVDFACVGDSPGTKRRHIERMNDIFQGAAVTIIAAAGDDATHGLPGVGNLSRAAQPKYSFTTSNVTLVSSLQDPRLLVKASTWYTRGWTYQEGVCARRRLIFTSEQMYWECDGMACPETMDLPLDFYHDADEERMCDFVRPGLFNGVSYLDGSWEQWRKLPSKLQEASTLSIFREADQHIANFTRRELSRDEDSLDAFQGVAKRLESTMGKGRLSNLVGIPIWAPPHGSAANGGGGDDDEGQGMGMGVGTMGLLRTRHLFALATSFWHHKDGVGARRRPHLPSWTWAGWAGGVDFFSSVVIATDANYTIKGRKVLNHHYVTATQLTRGDDGGPSAKWTYSPDMCVLSPDGTTVVYDFTTPLPGSESGSGFGDGHGHGYGSGGSARGLPPARYKLRVSNPLVLDRVKARTHPGGWTFNTLSVDVKMSGREGGTDTLSLEGQPDKSSIREYVERHGRGEQMTILWFVEEAMVMLLVVERVGARWERIGRMRMAFGEDGKDVMRACGRLEGMLARLPLRRLEEDIIIE